MKKIIILSVILFQIALFAQDTVKTSVLKKNFTTYKPIIKFKYPDFSIAEGYYLVKSANEGIPSSQHELALRYLFGKGFEIDTAKGVFWIKKAVEKKLPAACFNYGIMLLNEAGVKWDPFEAYKYFLIAAEKEMPEAQLIVGLFNLDNLIVNRDINKAVDWIGKAARRNYKPAQEVLLQIRENEGRFIDLSGAITASLPEDKKEDLSDKELTFELAPSESDSSIKAIENSNEKDVLNKPYGELKRVLGVKKSEFLENRGDTTSSRLVQQAIKWGNPEAIILNGMSYEKGTFNKKDLIYAASNYFRAYRLGVDRAANLILKLTGEQAFIDILNRNMEKGDLEAVYVWSAIIALNYNGKFTEAQSIDFLKKASDRGHIQSLIELGLCYYNGRGVAQDRNTALDYWSKAANLGSEDASIRIAFNNILNSQKSNSVYEDYKFLLGAYENGSLMAEIALGFCYEKGIVVKQNKSEANKFYRNAVKRGSEVAMNSLKRLYDEIRPDSEEFKVY